MPQAITWINGETWEEYVERDRAARFRLPSGSAVDWRHRLAYRMETLVVFPAAGGA